MPGTPDPCTQEAIDEGCTCRMSTVHSASIDPPHEVINPWCPLHGHRDADRELDKKRDREMMDGGRIDRLAREYDEC